MSNVKTIKGSMKYEEEKAVAKFLDKARAGKSYYLIAKETGISQAGVRAYCLGVTSPSAINFAKICKNLNVSESDISELLKKIS